MNIRKARLCVQCDEVHELMCCPVCGGHEFLSLHNYLPPLWPDPARVGVTGGMIGINGPPCLVAGGEYV
jgi:hypothetical protein